MAVRIINSFIVSAFRTDTIGTKVTNKVAFLEGLERAVEGHDFSGGDTPGQGVVDVDHLHPYVSGGVGYATRDPGDYVLREHRGAVSAYLRRELAVVPNRIKAVVYTAEAYLADPQVAANATEVARLQFDEATHVLVAVLAGPEDTPYTAGRLVANLAGGNRDALAWSADRIRQEALNCDSYWSRWSVVAD